VWARVRGGGAASFLLLWLAIPLAVLWMSSSRLTFYVLPLYAPVALAVARGVAARLAPPAALARATAVCVPSALVLVLLKGAVACMAPASNTDMAPLFAAVQAAAGTHPDVRAYGEDQLFGLQFYLGGDLRRVSEDGTEPWADEHLRSALAAIRSVPNRRTCCCAAKETRPPSRAR
jgi:hypothetical protein